MKVITSIKNIWHFLWVEHFELQIVYIFAIVAIIAAIPCSLYFFHDTKEIIMPLCKTVISSLLSGAVVLFILAFTTD